MIQLAAVLDVGRRGKLPEPAIPQAVVDQTDSGIYLHDRHQHLAASCGLEI